MGTPLRIIFLVKGGWQEGRSSPLFYGADQQGPEYLRNRVDVGLVRSSRRKKTPPLKVQLQRGWSPSLRERVELKVGWPTVKVPYIMVWGLSSAPFSLFYFSNRGVKN